MSEFIFLVASLVAVCIPKQLKHILFIQGTEGHLIVIMSIFISFLVD